MKLIGILMIIFSSFATGILLHLKEKEKLNKMRLLLLMFSELKNKMKSNLFSTKEIFLQFAHSKQYESLFFLKKCSLLLKDGNDFYTSYSKSISESEIEFPSKCNDMLVKFGSFLGTTDLEGQCSYIDLLLSYLEKECDILSQKEQKNGNMYISLSVLSGLAIAIMLC